jgi:dTDP-4-amino-4,6-dideoxygalactose transaminase
VVPLVDLTRRHSVYAGEFLSAVERVLGSGTVLMGPELDACEHELALLLGHRHTVGVSSGASALQLALRSVGVSAGDEVIVPAFTAVPTAAAVCALGAIPVLVDVDASTAAIDPARAAEAITRRTRAIVPVHLYGRPVDVAPLAAFGVPVIEDAAQAHGALRAITGAAAVYSFYPTKNLGGIGDGGAVATDDEGLAATVRRLRVHGMTEQYVHVDISQNFRMSEIEAAFIRLQLARLDVDNSRRRAIARRYRQAAPTVRWHDDHPDHVFHLCVARFTTRDQLRAELHTAGIHTAVHYPLAITQQPAYRSLATRPCPDAEAWAAETLSVPCSPELTDEEVETVASALARVPSDRPE